MMTVTTSIFVLAFIIVMSAATDAKVHEIFVGGAAYVLISSKVLQLGANFH